MTQYAAYDTATLAVYGLVDSVNAPAVAPGSPYAYGPLADRVASFPSPPVVGAVLQYYAPTQQLVWFDPRSVAQAKTERVDRLRDAREAAINSTFVWDGSTFDADAVSQTRLTNLALASQLAGYVATPWRLADNTWRTLSAADAQAVAAALAAHLRTQFQRFSTREAAVNSASTKSAVDAVTW